MVCGLQVVMEPGEIQWYSVMHKIMQVCIAHKLGTQRSLASSQYLAIFLINILVFSRKIAT